MTNLKTYAFSWRALSIGGAMVVAATMSASAAAGPKQNKDRETCASMGASYGSPDHTACMLQQQERRDHKMLRFLEEQRIHSELGRPAREKLEQKRARRERDRWRDER